jgi:hypothetical protein
MASGHKKRLKTLRLLGNKKRLKRLEERLEKRLEKRLKRLWARIGENLKRLRWTSGRWWLAWGRLRRWQKAPLNGTAPPARRHLAAGAAASPSGGTGARLAT